MFPLSTSIYVCKYIFCWLVTSSDSWTKCDYERQWLPAYLTTRATRVEQGKNIRKPVIGIFRQEGLLFVRHALFNTR
ncbi:hypothetical protein P8452_36415 [Trifolium repens]|nr:hypothetical protein P8452_23711 [Trifolium repens]WJX50056.1 hypothetical protein P8452_36415 [Trifolium repens]